MTRRALLLAISDYDPLPPLPYVTRDIPRMRRALASAGFDPGAIEAIGPGAEQGRSGVLTNTKLRSSIRQFLKNANIDDDLLLFLSGHGIEFQGRRIMLPPDYDLQEPQSPGDLIWDGWISEQARGSAARSIIVLIDACRDGAHYELAADKSAGAAGALADRPLENAFNTGIDGPIVAFLYSCSVGEQSGIDRLDQSCSAFTRAMAEAFEMETGPSELLPLAEAAKIRLSTYSDSRQTLVITGHDGRAGAWRRLTAKVDEAMRFRDRMDRSTWVKLVEQTELFRLVERSLGSFALQIRAVALRAEEQVAEAAQTLPAQRWRDEAAWKRMLDRLHSTFLIRKQESPIRAEEAAILLAVPFVYETVLAAVETRLSIADAIPDPETATSSGHMVAAWRNAWRESDAARMHSGLVIRGNHEAAEDQACWALVTFCHGTGELWDAQGGRPHRSGWVLDSLASLLSAAPFAEVMQDRRIPEILSMPRLMRLARLMFASFEDVTLDAAEDIQQLDVAATSEEGATQLTVNEVRLAHLLNLAARLALDPRRLSPLLAEHLGTDVVPTTRNLVFELSKAQWPRREAQGATEKGEDWFDLKLESTSDAVDAALLTVVDELEVYRTRLLQRQDVHATVMRDFLPAGFTANRLNSNPSGWHPTRPPLRFELNRTRIIGLLMGQNLYGERWPALRELYQNALDACRYRRAQQSLAIKEGRNHTKQPYEGRIEFRFGTDGRRRFVECVDDGIGMAERHVRRLFAYAGQRFADSHEFHIDRARWDEATVPFFPNSRFGIGVLSYFMLAEELDLISRRYAPEGLGPPPVRARIIGTGSLFRLEAARELTRLAGDYGTSIRLYLRSDAGEDSELVESILNWLWLPEVTTSIQSSSQDPIELLAGVPTGTFRNARRGVLLPVPKSESTLGMARLHIAPLALRHYAPQGSMDTHWSSEDVGLIDGIATELRHPYSEGLPRSLIIKFTEDFRAMPTVDRRELIVETKDRDEVWDCACANAAAALATWQSPEFVDLHATIAEFGPKAIGDLNALLVDTPNTFIPLRLLVADCSWPYGAVGLSEIDPTIAVEITCAKDSDFTRLYHRSRHDPGEYLHRLATLSVKLGLRRSTHFLVETALFQRLKTLIRAGFAAPEWFLAATAFSEETHVCSVPASGREVFKALEATGQVWLRDVIDWIDASQAPVRAAMRAIAAWGTGILTFNDDCVDSLSPLHLKLVRISAGNLLTNLDVAYFARSEGLSLAEANIVAQELAQHGGICLDSPAEEGCQITDEQLELLEIHYKSRLGRKNRLRVNLADIVVDLDHRTLLPVAKITEILLPLEQAVEELTVDISGQNTLDKQQLYLLSSDLDGRAPFLNKLTLSHLLKASADGELKDIDHVVSVARTLLALGAAVPSLAYLDDPTMGRLRTLPAASMRFIGRLADDSGEVRPVSIWDLGVAQNLTNRVWRGWDELRRRGFPRRRLFSRLLG